LVIRLHTPGFLIAGTSTRRSPFKDANIIYQPLQNQNLRRNAIRLGVVVADLFTENPGIVRAVVVRD
jgi:hypothetical protein